MRHLTLMMMAVCLAVLFVVSEAYPDHHGGNHGGGGHHGGHHHGSHESTTTTSVTTPTPTTTTAKVAKRWVQSGHLNCNIQKTMKKY